MLELGLFFRLFRPHLTLAMGGRYAHLEEANSARLQATVLSRSYGLGPVADFAVNTSWRQSLASAAE